MPNPLAVLEIARKRIDHVLEIFSPGIILPLATLTSAVSGLPASETCIKS
jgi:hypothetical protein